MNLAWMALVVGSVLGWSFACMVVAGSDDPPVSPLVLLKAGQAPVALFGHDPKRSKPHLDYVQLPGGPVVTRRFPMVKDQPGETRDHPHHRGVWFAHGDVALENHKPPLPIPGLAGIDFWSEGAGRGRIQTRSPTPEHGPAGEIIWTCDWRDPAGAILLTERQTWSTQAVGPDWLILFETELQATAGTVTFGDTKEGTFGLRLAEGLTPKRGGVLTNSKGGKGEAECWGQLADWVDVSGTLDGKEVGVALFDDAGNPHRAAWHVRSYGLLAANPFGRARSGFPGRKGQTDLVTLPAGATLRLRYAICLHEGRADPERLRRAYTEFCKGRGNAVQCPPAPK